MVIEPQIEREVIFMKKNREFIQLNNKQMNQLRELLRIKLIKCHYCKKKIDFNKDKYSIYNKPTRLICNDIICVAEATN